MSRFFLGVLFVPLALLPTEPSVNEGSNTPSLNDIQNVLSDVANHSHSDYSPEQHFEDIQRILIPLKSSGNEELNARVNALLGHLYLGLQHDPARFLFGAVPTVVASLFPDPSSTLVQDNEKVVLLHQLKGIQDKVLPQSQIPAHLRNPNCPFTLKN